MELLQLKYFLSAAITENFSKTAKKFDVPASNISQCIKRLETELGVKLFVRGHNSLVLNREGKMFYKKVSEAMRLLDVAKEEIKSSLTGHLCVCAMTNRSLVMKATEVFHTRYQGVSVSISHTFDDKTDYDMIICDEDFCREISNKTLILTEKISLAMSKENPLSNLTKLTGDDIRNENFVSLNPESSLGKCAEKICKDAGFEANIIIQSPDPFYVRKCVELNLGIAFVPTVSWQNQFAQNVVIKDFGSLERKTYALLENTGNIHAKNLMDILINMK